MATDMRDPYRDNPYGVLNNNPIPTNPAVESIKSKEYNLPGGGKGGLYDTAKQVDPLILAPAPVRAAADWLYPEDELKLPDNMLPPSGTNEHANDPNSVPNRGAMPVFSQLYENTAAKNTNLIGKQGDPTFNTNGVPLPHDKVDLSFSGQLAEAQRKAEQEAEAAKQAELERQKQLNNTTKDVIPNDARSHRTSLDNDPKPMSTYEAGYKEGPAAGEGGVYTQNPQHTADEFRSKYNQSAGIQAADFHGTNVEWYEDDAFYKGLMRWGLGVMGGEGYGAAYDNANKLYTQTKGVESRREWADQMTDDYDPRSIQAWIQSGDEKDLKSYEDMSYQANKRQNDLNTWASAATPEEAAETRRLNRQATSQNILNSRQQYYQNSKRFPLELEQARANLDLTNARTNKSVTGGTGSGGKPSEYQYKQGAVVQDLLGSLYDTDTLKVPDTSSTLGGLAASVVTPNSPAGLVLRNKLAPDDYTSLMTKRNNIVEGYSRALSGAQIRDEEKQNLIDAIFPTNDSPAEIRRAIAARLRIIGVAQNATQGLTGSAIPAEVLQGVADDKVSVQPIGNGLVKLTNLETGTSGVFGVPQTQKQ